MYLNAFILLKLLTSNHLKEVKDGIPFGMSLTSFILCAASKLPPGSLENIRFPGGLSL